MQPKISIVSFFSQLVVISVIIKQSLSQTTFYYDDENIRFYQVTLVPATGTINNQSAVTFTKPTDFVDNVTNVELALCGFSLQNQMNMEYTASIKYGVGSFNISVQAYNETSFQYISFYAIIFRTQASGYFQSRSVCQQCTVLNQNPNKNRTQTIFVQMNTNRSSGTNYYVRPYIRSMKTRQAKNGYTRLQVAYSGWDIFTTKVTLVISTYESIVTEACVTVTVLLNSAVGNNYTYLISQQPVRQFTAASIKSLPTNFAISSTMYGPIFNKKCLIGFQNLYFRDGIKQIYFDATKTGITGLTQNTPQYFYAEFIIFCVTRTKTCASNQGIQTGIQECVNCSVMIKNCAFCLTESQCTSCLTGFFIDLSRKCCPIYLANCSICSLGNTCTQCADGFYSSQTGTCTPCSNAVTNCARCQNGTFCYECAKGYQVGNYTACTKIQAPDSTTNSSTTNTTDDSAKDEDAKDDNNTTTESGVSSWLILFIICAGVCGLLLAVIIVLCVKRNQRKEDGFPITPTENEDQNPKDQPIQTMGQPTSLENHRLTEINPNFQPRSMVNESEVKAGSGMQFRYGSKFNSYLTNLIDPKPKTFLKEGKSTKDLNSVQSSQLKPTKNKESLISSGMQRPSQFKPSQIADLQNQPESDRGFIAKNTKNSAFLPQLSKNTQKFGGSIHLKANYYK